MKKTLFKSLVFLIILPVFSQQESSFKEGEWLKFNMSYSKFLRAGTATLHVKEEKLNNKDVYHVIGKGWTSGMIKWFFKVEDLYESYFDKKTNVPYKFIRNINEGGYVKDVEINFDQANNKAYVNDKQTQIKSVYTTKPKIQDIISIYYYLRNNMNIDNLKIGDDAKVYMFFDDENYGFKLDYLGDETIDTNFGKIECLKFRPNVMSGRVFKKEESLTLWVSKDKNKLPLRLKADLAVGSLRADLEAYNGLKYPLKPVAKN